jgi:erythronate-4-phosphate dehydrogenase
MFKILVDENIPFAVEAFSEIGSVRLISGRDITNESLKTIDILIVRSITRVDGNLLKNTPVKFVGTTTIGSDHIDTGYLQRNNIGFANAPGCNADSVAEYILTALLQIASNKNIRLGEKSIGIIGYGNIGSRIARIAESFGMRTFINDPPLQRNTGQTFFVPYEKALQGDIITFHVPLNMTGIDKTYHMLSGEHMQRFDTEKIIFNSSRGSVVSNDDLKALLAGNRHTVVLDVWENEPQIDIALLRLVQTGTAHIAGYSYEGKVNGTVMIFNSLCRFLGLNKRWNPLLPVIENSAFEYPETGQPEKSLYLLLSGIYNIEQDDRAMREMLKLDEGSRGKHFDILRKNYPVRREFSNYTISINKSLRKEIKILKALRFNVKTN